MNRIPSCMIFHIANHMAPPLSKNTAVVINSVFHFPPTSAAFCRDGYSVGFSEENLRRNKMVTFAVVVN